MSSSFSGKLRLEKQGIGENQNTWGTKLNATIDQIDDAIAGFVSIDMTSGGNVTPSKSNGVADESRMATLILTGTPTSNVGLDLPNTGKNYIIRNKITNSTSIRLQVEGDAGNELKIPSDFVGQIHSDGVNIYEVGRQQDLSEVSVALRDDITSIRDELSVVSHALAGSVARTDADNDFDGNVITNFLTSVESSTGGMTFVSSDSGKVFVLENAASINLTLNKALPVGWNATLVALTSNTVNIHAPTSCSMVNTSAHTALNNYGSAAALLVVKQEGANSHAWYLFQGETQ